MHVSYRILLSCAVLSAVFAQASLLSAAAGADEYDDFVAASVRPSDNEDDDFVAAPVRPADDEDDDLVAAPVRPADDENDDLVASPVRPAQIGAIHLIVARSTLEDDPFVKRVRDEWLEHIRGIMGFESSFSHNGSPYPGRRAAQLGPDLPRGFSGSGLGRRDRRFRLESRRQRLGKFRRGSSRVISDGDF